MAQLPGQSPAPAYKTEQDKLIEGSEEKQKKQRKGERKEQKQQEEAKTSDEQNTHSSTESENVRMQKKARRTEAKPSRADTRVQRVNS